MPLLIRQSDYKQMPWKNGLGQTAEVDRIPAGAENYLWRLSQAAVQADSPFSVFPGFDRYLVVLRGDGLYLNERQLDPLQPLRFSGEEEIHCRLIGKPVLDAGLIFNRARVAAHASIVTGEVFLEQKGLLSVHYLISLQSCDTLKVEGAAQLTVAQSVLFSVHQLS